MPLNLFLILHGVDQAATRYALVIFLCDGLLKVNKQLKNDAMGRFFAIAKLLPMEIQMLLCQRASSRTLVDDISDKKGRLAFFAVGEFFRQLL